jgi:hypothetical protein
VSYSIEGLLFRAVAAAVNTAARGANALLQTMYPPDISHIWDDPAVTGGGAADPHPAADEAGVTPPTPASSLTWRGWAEPAVLEVLSEHQRRFDCNHPRWGDCRCGFKVFDSSDWDEHVAPLICDRIACDPTRAAVALTSLQTQ